MTIHPSLKLSPEKRSLLLNAAREEFSEYGFSRASLNRIIADVRMSKSSFYHYFENKTDLFHQTIEQNMAPVLGVVDMFDLNLLTKENFWPMIEQMSGEMTSQINESPDFILIARMFFRIRNNAEDVAITEHVIDIASEWIERLLKRGQELGVLREDLPTSFLMDGIMALGMAVDGWMVSHWDELDEAERCKIQKQAFDLFVRLLEPRQVVV